MVILTRNLKSYKERVRTDEMLRAQKVFSERENRLREEYLRDKDAAVKKAEREFKRQLEAKDRVIQKKERIIKDNKKAYYKYRRDAERVDSLIHQLHGGLQRLQRSALDMQRYFDGLRDEAERVNSRMIRNDEQIVRLLNSDG